MSNILFTYEAYEPTNAELFRLLDYAGNKYSFSVRNRPCMRIEKSDIEWADIILSVRSASSFEWRLAKYAKQLGKLWILMLDDDLLSLGKSYGKDGQGYRPAKKKALLKILSYTDCLLAVNKLLAERYCEIGSIPRYILTNTPFYNISFKNPGIKETCSERVKIVFYVNDGTEDMFNSYLKPLMPELHNRYKNTISLYFLAIKPELEEYKESLDIHYVPHMNFDDFHKYMDEQGFDIGLAPLNNEGFSKYKYFNKYIEYTRAGIAGIYSDCELYRQVIIQGENGMLCSNSTESWMNALSELIEDREKRVGIANSSQKYVQDHFMIDVVADKLVSDFPEFLDFNSPEKKCNTIRLGMIRLCYLFFRVSGWGYTLISCIKSGNYLSLIRRINQKINIINRKR